MDLQWSQEILWRGGGQGLEKKRINDKHLHCTNAVRCSVTNEQMTKLMHEHFVICHFSWVIDLLFLQYLLSDPRE